MALARFVLGLCLAVAIFALGQWIDPRFALGIDPLLILALYHGLRSGPLSSAVGGTAIGLVHDALTGGLFGLHGFADTAAAVVTNTVRQRFVIHQSLQVGLLCLLGAAVQVALLALLQLALLGDPELPSPTGAVVTVITAGIAGAAIYELSGRVAAALQGRRVKRRQRVRL